MPQPIISVENLSKAYRIGAKEEAADTIMGAMTNSLRAPWRNFRRLREATTIGDNEEGDNVLWALKDVSFDVNEGEVVGIIGRNGAGKSTLLKILSRITEPTNGRVVIRGRVSSLLEVGTGFHPELTGRENVYMNGTILGMTKREIDRKFDEIVHFSGVEKFLDTATKHYSSGMQVRLAFAVAAHLEPEILIIDEVLAVGDAEFQKKCLGKMQDVAKGGRTVLFVSHNMAAVRQLCGHALIIQNGSLHLPKSVNEAIDTYLKKGGDQRGIFQLPSATGENPLAPQIRSVKINAGDALTHGSPWSFELEIHTQTPLDNVKAALGLSSIEGTRILTVDSATVDATVTMASPGQYVIKAALSELLLQPGLYFVDVGLRQRSGATIHYKQAIGQVTVIPSKNTPPEFCWGSVGGVRLPAEWSLSHQPH